MSRVFNILFFFFLSLFKIYAVGRKTPTALPSEMYHTGKDFLVECVKCVRS